MFTLGFLGCFPLSLALFGVFFFSGRFFAFQLYQSPKKVKRQEPKTMATNKGRGHKIQEIEVDRIAKVRIQLINL